MTDKELLVVLNAAIADARAAAAAANTAAASANQASAGSAAGVAGARTQSNVEQADVSKSALNVIADQVESDIDTPEAWKANVKRTYDVHQSADMESFSRNRVHFDGMVTQLQTHLANINQLTLQSLANNQNQSNLNNTLSIDRSWNINETDLSAKSAAVLTDAILSRAAITPKK